MFETKFVFNSGDAVIVSSDSSLIDSAGIFLFVMITTWIVISALAYLADITASHIYDKINLKEEYLKELIQNLYANFNYLEADHELICTYLKNYARQKNDKHSLDDWSHVVVELFNEPLATMNEELKAIIRERKINLKLRRAYLEHEYLSLGSLRFILSIKKKKLSRLR